MDIDLDFSDRNKVLSLLKHIPASMKTGKSHNTGIYFQKIPINPLTGNAAINYKEAESRGYFKMDFLNVSVYKDIINEEHLNKLIEQEPLWELLLQDEFVNMLFHLHGHSSILKKTKPTSIEQLAAVLAIIRPAKRYLIDKDWTAIMNEVWIKPNDDEYYFKKAHAISYAILIVVQMNIICNHFLSQGAANGV